MTSKSRGNKNKEVSPTRVQVPEGVPVLKPQKVLKACVPCRNDKVGCDAQRPCTRCVKNGIPVACIDAPKKPRTKKSKEPANKQSNSLPSGNEGSDYLQEGLNQPQPSPPLSQNSSPHSQNSPLHLQNSPQPQNPQFHNSPPHSQTLLQYQHPTQFQASQQPSFVDQPPQHSMQYPILPSTVFFQDQNRSPSHFQNPQPNQAHSQSYIPQPPLDQTRQSPLFDNLFFDPPQLTQSSPQTWNQSSPHIDLQTPCQFTSDEGAFAQDLASANEKIEALSEQLTQMNINMHQLKNIHTSFPETVAYPDYPLPSYLDPNHPLNYDPTPTAIWIREDKQFVDCNELFANFLGYDSVAQLLLQHDLLNYFDIISPKIKHKAIQTCADAFAKGIQYLERPGLFILKDGSEMKVWLKISYHGPQFVITASVPDFSNFVNLPEEGLN